MARRIHVQHGGIESTFEFQKIDRARLYGKRRRIVLDDEGELCVKAELSEDGVTLLRSGMTMQAYFDDTGEWVEHNQLVGIDSEGEVVPKVNSTLGVAQDLTPATPGDLSQSKVLAVYFLENTEVDAGLLKALAKGEIFQFPFSYRGDYSMDTAFLLSNDSGTFVLVTRPSDPNWCELASNVANDFDEDEVGDDDLDFEMF